MTRTELTAILLSTLYLDYVEETGDRRPDIYTFDYNDFSDATFSLTGNDKVRVTVEIITT